MKIEQEWQPISTAPKDGREVLVCGPKFGNPKRGQYVDVAVYDSEYDAWVDGEDSVGLMHEPTHWMALPSPPTKPS